MADTNIGETLCQVIDDIVYERINGLAYDKTILCTILDDSEKEQGRYMVEYASSAKFIAYSDSNKYKKSDNVYVTIPQGDWNAQKYITGKQIKGHDESYINPTNSYVDMTGNLVAGDKQNASLTANGSTESIVVWTWGSLSEDNGTLPLQGYQQLEITGEFQSWINSFTNEATGDILSVKQGNYGLRLIIESSGDQLEGAEQHDPIRYVLTLAAQDMNGNPYDFSFWSQQKKVFDISQIDKISGMRLEFFQEPNTFLSSNEIALPSTDFLGNEVTPNLFAKDATVTLGYNIEYFNNAEKEVQLFTLDPYYNKNSDKKNVNLRWIHKDGDSIRQITQSSNLDYEIRWYRYKQGHPSDDSYGNVEWVRQETTGNKDFSFSFSPNSELNQERIKAIIILGDNQGSYSSLPITFYNQENVEKQILVNSIQSLSIKCDDDKNANYFIYQLGGSLIERSEGYKTRTLSLQFTEPGSGTTVTLDSDDNLIESIEWTIPERNSMLLFKEKNDELKNTYQLHYTIRSLYAPNYTNNVVSCKVVRNGFTYTANLAFRFGPAGTAGTDYTFLLDFVQVNSTDEFVRRVLYQENPVKVQAYLYDNQSNLIDLSDRGVTIAWEWKDGVINNNISLTPNGSSCQAAIVSYDNIDKSYSVLQATLMGWGDYNLIAYLPIPYTISESLQDKFIIGPTEFVYDSQGNLDNSYSKVSYSIYNDENPQAWESSNANLLKKIEVRQKTNAVIFRPLSFYALSENDQCIIYSDNWWQPILIRQNLYSSNTLNKWSGELSVGENDKGTILAPRLGAGKKNKNNQFTGVIMGDWKQDNNEKTLGITGLYGFKDGAQTFGFKEDGTAFIGASGGGRIEFDGNESTIKSSGWSETGGLLFNINGGRIDLRNGSNSIILDASATGDKESPLTVGSNFKVDWDGKATMTNADVNGKITATSGTIGGWTILPGKIYSGDTSEGKGIAVQSDPATYAFVAGADSHTAYESAKFSVTHKGELYAANAHITGEITATSGTIGGCTIDKGSLVVDLAHVTGTLRAENIDVSNLVVSKAATITGKITADQIDVSGGKITADQIDANALKVNSISLTSREGTFTVSSKGELNANYGKIGGWTLSTNSITASNNNGSISLFSSHPNQDKQIGNITSQNWRIIAGNRFGVTADGTLSASNVNITGVIKATSGEFTGTVNATAGSISAWNLGSSDSSLSPGPKNNTIWYKYSNPRIAIGPLGIFFGISDPTISQDKNCYLYKWQDILKGVTKSGSYNNWE